MGRRAKLTNEDQVRRFVLAVYRHPWARPSLIQAYSGLSRKAIERVARPLALKHGWVERGDLPGPARSAQRFGITPTGTAYLGKPFSRVALRDAYLRAHHLDGVRQLLAEWKWMPGTIWSCSPFTVSAKHIRPPRSPHKPKPKPSKKPKAGEYGDGAYHSLRFDALACVRVASGEYRHIAVWVDPGHLSLDWFYHQFRSAYAWSRRSEFRSQRMNFPFPAFVVLAASEGRRQEMLRLWREAHRSGEHPLWLRLTTVANLALPAEKRLWWSERRDEIKGDWNRLIGFDHNTLAPASATSEWWGEPADANSAIPFQPRPTKRLPLSLLAWAKRAKSRKASIVRLHQRLSQRGRALLDCVGQYPLITPNDLAVVLDYKPKAVAEGMGELAELGLIHRPRADEPGYALTSWGLELLAAQVGLSPKEYAKLRRWPTRIENRVVMYAVEGFLACRRHTQLVQDFLVGLRRYGPLAQMLLLAWDQVQCAVEYPFQPTEKQAQSQTQLSASRSTPPRISPDGKGSVRAYGATLAQFTDTTFWLEVDRSTEKGQVLLSKLARYYRLQSGSLTPPAEWPRLLMVVERDDEARLQALRRRLVRLNKFYNRALNVRLTRVDLLDDGTGRLDPTKNVWRTLDASEFVGAFDQPSISMTENSLQ